MGLEYQAPRVLLRSLRFPSFPMLPSVSLQRLELLLLVNLANKRTGFLTSGWNAGPTQATIYTAGWRETTELSFLSKETRRWQGQVLNPLLCTWSPMTQPVHHRGSKFVACKNRAPPPKSVVPWVGNLEYLHGLFRTKNLTLYYVPLLYDLSSNK